MPPRHTRRFGVLGMLVIMLGLLACGPAAQFGDHLSRGSDGPPAGGSAIPIAFSDLPPNAACRIAAQWALTAQGALYSQHGHMPCCDPVDPTTGAYYLRTGPRSYDCSGLTWRSYREAGMALGRVVSEQANDGYQVPCTLADLNGPATTCWATGDLIVLDFPERPARGDHVAIYIKDGLFMDCFNHTVNCVLHDVADLSAYQYGFWQARRIVPDCARPVVAGRTP